MPYTPIPYARRPYDTSEGSVRLADLVRRQGESVANRELRAGDISANLGMRLGDLAAGVAQQLGRIPEERRRAEEQTALTAERQALTEERRQRIAGQQQENRNEATAKGILGLSLVAGPNGVQTYDREMIRREFQAANLADRLPAIEESLNKIDESHANLAKAKLTTYGHLAQGVMASGNTPQALKLALGLGVANEAISPEWAEKIWSGVGGDEATPDAISQLTTGLMSQAGIAPPKPSEGQVVAPGAALVKDGQEVYRNPAKETQEPNPTEWSVLLKAAGGDAQKALTLYRQQHPESARASEPLVPIVGPDGKTVYGTRSEAAGKVVPSGNAKPATGLEKRALNFFNRAAQADKDLEAFEPEIQKLGLMGQAWMQGAPNFLQTELGQQYTQAQRAFTEARLRKDSGAAIPEQEFANDRKTYFAQPGDSEATLAQKRRARAAVLASLGFESGQALGEFVGDADEAKRVVDEYRTRADKTTSQPAGTPQGTATGPKKGETRTVGGVTGVWDGKQWVRAK